MMCSAALSSTRATRSRISVVALWIREIFNHSRDRVTATHVAGVVHLEIRSRNNSGCRTVLANSPSQRSSLPYNHDGSA